MSIFKADTIAMKPSSTLLAITLSLILACEGKDENNLIRTAASLLDSKPDSSLCLLNSINPNNLASSAQKARYALYLSAAYDKNYIDIHSDSLISIATSYYSNHGNEKEQLLSWYYTGIVQKNMQDYTSAVVSFEKAAEKAMRLKDAHFSGLIYRNVSSCFNESNNIEAAIDYMKKSIWYFSQMPSDSLYLQYAKYSLAIGYYNNNDYSNAQTVLKGIDYSFNASLKSRVRSLSAKLEIMSNDNYYEGLELYRGIPSRYLSLQDLSIIAYAYSKVNKPDSSDLYLNHAYSFAKNEADSASIDYKRSIILFNRGRVSDAFKSLQHATDIQDSLTRTLLTESIVSAQRDYFKEEAESESLKRLETRRRTILFGIIGILVTILIIFFFILRSWKKDQWLKELMAQEAINNQSIRQLSKQNSFLLSTHYSELIRQIDHISHEYYQSDSQSQKEIVFKQYKEYVGSLNNDGSFYKTLEDDLNRYCNEIMKKFRQQVPSINGQNLKNAALFFAGLSYETVAIITHAHSIASLKMQKTRIRKAVEESDAPDKLFFIDMLETKRPPARKTNE